MLLYFSLLLLEYFWPASTLLHGHIALATPSLPETDPHILEHWVTLMTITWANHSRRWILVSNVSVTYDGFCEFYRSDWFPYVWALPQNRWRLRRLHFLEYATQLSCTWWVSVQNKSPCSLRLLIPFQHGHCTFVTILFRPFARLFINLAMCIRALFTKSAYILRLVEQAYWRMPFSQNELVQVPLR